jgi:hypothetical protein
MMLGAFMFRLRRHGEEGAHGIKNPLPVVPLRRGCQHTRRLDTQPTRRAAQRGGVSIAELLMARATAPYIILPDTVSLRTYAYEYSALLSSWSRGSTCPDGKRSGAGPRAAAEPSRWPGGRGEAAEARVVDQSFFTAWACGPLGPWVTVNSTSSPSLSDLKPDS